MSDRERRGEKRKSEIGLDEARAAATAIELERSKERYKRLHSLVCKKAQEIIHLKSLARDLIRENQRQAARIQAQDLRISELTAPDLD